MNVSTSSKVRLAFGEAPALPLSVYRVIGVWQQESGKGPRLANGAAKLRTTVTVTVTVTT